jgi:polyhydroxyalkanoate synthesis regulator phasin
VARAPSQGGIINGSESGVSLDELVYEIGLLKNKFEGVEKVKNDHWFDTSKKLGEIENKFVAQDKILNQKIKEIKDNIFSNFSKNNFEISNKNSKKMEIYEQQNKELRSHIESLEKRISKSLENREE